MDRSEIAENHVAFRRLDFPDLGAKQAVCPSHGPFESKGKLFGKREIWTTCQGCAKDAENARVEAFYKEAAERRARQREEMIGQACIPLRFRELSFETYNADTPEQLGILSRVRDYAERFAEISKQGRGLVFAGKPGTGKTHLAASLALALVDTGAWVQYVTCMGLIRMVRETWGKDPERTERQVVKLLGQQIDLLLIDEVGVQYGTESEQHILFEILDKRYAEMRPTVLITNQDKTGFKALIGERVADRLTQTHDWLAFDWLSYRKQARSS